MVSIIILYYNIIIIWDHRISLTETSLCGAWLYKFLLPWRPRISHDWTWHRLIYKWYWIQTFSLISDLKISGCSNWYQKWDWYVFIGWLPRALHVASHIVMSYTVREVNCILHSAVLWYELSFWWWKQFAVYRFIRWVAEHMREISWLWWFSYFRYHRRMCHTCAFFS